MVWAVCILSRHRQSTFADTPTATIYTGDIARALRVAGKIEAGTVGINSAFATSPQTPFGGVKQSGYGRESGVEGLKEYLQPKTIHINMNVPPKKP